MTHMSHTLFFFLYQQKCGNVHEIIILCPDKLHFSGKYFVDIFYNYSLLKDILINEEVPEQLSKNFIKKYIYKNQENVADFEWKVKT